MNIETVRMALLWCAAINAGFLLLWALILMLPHGWMHRLHCRLFRLSPEQVDSTHYAGLLLYKTGFVLFNLVPCAALYLVR
jgi:hypothetical protein